MKYVWMNFLAIIIALSALVVEGPSFQVNFDALSAIQQIPQFDVSPLRNDTKKHSEKTIHIAQDFVPVVVIADPLDPNSEFDHYLPLHSLLRQKEYFLLI